MAFRWVPILHAIKLIWIFFDAFAEKLLKSLIKNFRVFIFHQYYLLDENHAKNSGRTSLPKFKFFI